jgi:hypothetical protein
MGVFPYLNKDDSVFFCPMGLQANGCLDELMLSLDPSSL